CDSDRRGDSHPHRGERRTGCLVEHLHSKKIPPSKIMKNFLFILGLVTFGSLSLKAADAPAAPAATNAPPAPTLEQRVAGLEAYIGNGDPSAAVAALKDKDGNLPKDFNMATLNTPGPGHNAWQMASA